MTKNNPVPPREISPVRRIRSFDEVVLGYSENEALCESKRCIQCKNPTCIKGCPVNIDIKKFIYEIANRNYEDAYYTIKEKNNFPSICGRVCPAEYQCRKTCVLNKNKGAYSSEEAINIHLLERFAGDYGIEKGLEVKKTEKNDKKGRVAVVGSGPAGLSCAGELARSGMYVDVFESLHEFGGVLGYGIPAFRLPREVLNHEINYLKDMGVIFHKNIVIGKTKTIQDLNDEAYTHVFLGLGAGSPMFMGLKNENICNIYSSNEFLTRANLMRAEKFPEFHTPVNIGNKIYVVGGGNTAIDSARVALRIQNISGVKGDVSVLYRRGEEEMPARRMEIEHAKEEGVKFVFLTEPIELISDGRGSLSKIKAIKCKLGKMDSSGRRKPVRIEGSEAYIPADMLIVAIGQRANTHILEKMPNIEISERGYISVDEKTLKTLSGNVFAGGDIVAGGGTVIHAMSMGKIASKSILTEKI